MNKPLLFFSLIIIITASYCIYDAITKPTYAYLDLDAVFTDFNLQKELTYKFEAFQNSKQNALDSLEGIAQAIYSEVQKNPSEDLKSKFNYSRENYLKFKQKFEQESNELTQQYDQQILNQMNEYIQDYGRLNKYTIIFGTNGNGTVMYADSSCNITPDVIKYINAKYDGLE
jgi:outer membrane protein